MDEKERMKKLLSETQHRWKQQHIDEAEVERVLVEGGFSKVDVIKLLRTWQKEMAVGQRERQETEEARESVEGPEGER